MKDLCTSWTSHQSMAAYTHTLPFPLDVKLDMSTCISRDKRGPTLFKRCIEPYSGFWRGPCRGGGCQSAGASSGRETQATRRAGIMQFFAAPVIPQDLSVLCLTSGIEEEHSAVGERWRQRLSSGNTRDKTERCRETRSEFT